MFAKTTALSIICSILAAVVWVFIIATNTSTNGFVIYPVSAQMNNSNNNTNKNTMNFAMGELAKLHLMIADQALKNGNTTAAFNQMNLAYLQLAMLGMKDMGTLNETQAMKCATCKVEEE